MEQSHTHRQIPVLRDDAHEAVLSVGLETDFGRTGSEPSPTPFTTLTPNLYFGKGFGDLPDSLAPCGRSPSPACSASPSRPSAAVPNAFNWGFAVEYSLPYLQQQVKDIGLPAPFKDLIPLVEFAMHRREPRRQGPHHRHHQPRHFMGHGLLELGAEALIPVNAASGRMSASPCSLDLHRRHLPQSLRPSAVRSLHDGVRFRQFIAFSGLPPLLPALLQRERVPHPFRTLQSWVPYGARL